MLLTSEELKQIPKKAQTQASLADQLQTLQAVANQLGFYDAADFIQKSSLANPPWKFPKETNPPWLGLMERYRRKMKP